MGSYYSQIAKIFSLGQRECRILILGLDAAGKTTILYSLKMGEKVETIPTIGFNVESLQYKKLNFVVWDVGGQDRIRALWKHYYQGTHGLIFVVDSQDDERLLEAKKELESILENHEMNDVPVLIFANKQDLDGALKVNQIAERMALTRKTNKWFVQPACATSGQGLYEGLDWLADKITSSNYH